MMSIKRAIPLTSLAICLAVSGIASAKTGHWLWFAFSAGMLALGLGFIWFSDQAGTITVQGQPVEQPASGCIVAGIGWAIMLMILAHTLRLFFH